MKKPSLLACLALLVFTRSAWTDPLNLPPNSSRSANEDQVEDRQVLEEKLPPEARKRLREVLDSYSRQAYPDGEQLAEKMRQHGLRDVWFKPLTFGIATLYVGRK